MTLVFCLVLWLAGCGSKTASSLPAAVPTSGIVLFKGQPLKDASVTFFPEGAENPATGRTNASGRFTLTTYKQDDGAITGKHKVTVQVFPVGGLPGAEVASTGGTVIPAKYADRTSSPLSAEVKSAGPNDVELKLEN